MTFHNRPSTSSAASSAASATYLCKVPVTNDQGNASFNCTATYRGTYRADALQTYNSMRAHDGQEPLARLPAGTTFKRVET